MKLTVYVVRGFPNICTKELKWIKVYLILKTHKKELCPPALILSGQSLGEFRSEERE